VNGKTHLAAGLLCGVFVEVAYSLATKRQVILSNLALSGLAGALSAALPDVLEPAVDPNHRSLCHGGLAVCGVAYGLRKVVTTAEMPDWLGALARGALVGYASHLVLDATSPKGLPLLA